MLKEMQELIGSEGASAARVRKYREKYKVLQCNDLVTIGNSSEIEMLRREKRRK